MKTLNSVSEVKLMTFEKFLLEILHCTGHDSRSPKEFNTLINYSMFVESEEDGFVENIATYQRCMSGWCLTDEELKNSLIPQCGVQRLFMKDIRMLAEEACIKSIENYGVPTCLVQLAPRLYLVANPEDWRIYQSTDGKRAICGTERVRNIIVNIDRMTQVEADKAVKEYPQQQGK